MTDAPANPFVKRVSATRAQILPWASVVLGSLVTALPFVSTIPVLPPAGLLMLLGWRMFSRFSLRPWAAAPLGFVDDLVSGQPLGSAVLLWSLCMIGIGLLEQRLAFRDFWQDWLIASGAMACVLIAGRFIALPFNTHVDTMLAVQIVMTVLLFPVATRLIALIDAKRGMGV